MRILWERFKAFIVGLPSKLWGDAPEWGDGAKVAYSDADLRRLEKLEERRRRGLL